MNSSDLLIVGAGPTGLVLALWLARLGIRARLIDKAAESGQTSRALVVHARTLELYKQLGIADKIVAHGLKFLAANLWVKGEHKGRVEFGSLGRRLSPYPFMLILPQDEHEKLLAATLEEAGISVERSTELLGLEENADSIVAQLRHADGMLETLETQFVAGCDGARSAVRESLGLEYPGGTYAHRFYVADVEATGPTMNGELHAALDETDFLACFPLQDKSRARIIGTVREAAIKQGETLTFDDVGKHVIERLHLGIAKVNWFSTYHVHHRVASAFHRGRAFLLGDAAHIHSPIGGQGMNTGIGDAVNLAWKLAAVLKRTSPRDLLDTYGEERIPFAQRLVRTTDRAFELVTATGPVADIARLRIAPRVVASLSHYERARRFLFENVSQIKINYRESSLSKGRAGAVHGGDRLPWFGADEMGENYSPLRTLRWQVHLYGSRSVEVRRACEQHRLPLYVFQWSPRAKAVGIIQDAAYLVRPDGHAALASDASHFPHDLEGYVGSAGNKTLRVRTFAARPSAL